MNLPESVIEQDHRLEESQNTAQEDLARLRWHWTIDETNENRVAVKAYARAIGRHPFAVTKSAKGYATWVGQGGLSPLGECIERAAVSVERQSVIEAVAEVEGVTYQSAARRHRDEIKAVRKHAAVRAEKRGTTVEEEAPGVAEMRAKARAQDAQRQADRKERTPLRALSASASLMKARRLIVEALNEIRDVEFTDDEAEVLAADVKVVKAVVGLFEVALTGATDTDWDAELASLTGSE